MKSRAGKSASKPKRSHPKFAPVSPEQQHWFALLSSELLTWPRVRTQPMFGFLAFYRARRIFAAIPRSRTFLPPSAFMLKFDPPPTSLLRRAESDPRVNAPSHAPGNGWFTFQLASDADLRDALDWLARAHRFAARRS